MEESKTIGINLSGVAAPPPIEGVQTVLALARAIEENARAVGALALAFPETLKGTPGVQGATISNCSISMAPPKRKRK